MESTSNKDFEDLANGCILGAFCGDAIGSYLEFRERERICEEDIREAMEMYGGGPFELGPGQITDDSELALCLGHGLVSGNGKLDINKIADQYRKWIESRPFDVGTTIGKGMRAIAGKKDDLAKRMRTASIASLNSQSNGALMRITPLCVWASKLSLEDLKKAAREDTRLTHPNQTVINVSIAYVATIHHLLNNKGDYSGAYQKCKDVIKSLEDEELKAWMNDIDKGENALPPADQNMGWVKIAFCYAIFYLKNNWDYEKAMRHLLDLGGDTDTNCCIAGGILGALHGESKLPKEQIKKVLELDTKEDGRERPAFLEPRKCLRKMISDIIAIRPAKLEMEGEESKEEKESAPKEYDPLADFR